MLTADEARKVTEELRIKPIYKERLRFEQVINKAMTKAIIKGHYTATVDGFLYDSEVTKLEKMGYTVYYKGQLIGPKCTVIEW